MHSLRGVLSPVVTPFTAELRPDAARLVRHCRWLLANDVGLAVFGTNSEGNSLTVTEKLALLDAPVDFVRRQRLGVQLVGAHRHRPLGAVERDVHGIRPHDAENAVQALGQLGHALGARHRRAPGLAHELAGSQSRPAIIA